MDDLAAHKRFFSKVDATGDCWEWTASRTKAGYGQYWRDGALTTAHRASWEILVGTIPKGFFVDHLCRNPGCVNPDHLEPVPPSVNSQRGITGKHGNYHNGNKTCCKRGHEFTPENTRLDSKGGRRCRECAAIHESRRVR